MFDKITDLSRISASFLAALQPTTMGWRKISGNHIYLKKKLHHAWYGVIHKLHGQEELDSWSKRCGFSSRFKMKTIQVEVGKVYV